MKSRSPVLGYNHNVRYAARLWHVQTEDSGVQAPHVFTHLFCDGTILASKKLDYDPESAVAAVQKLMQTQHKAMLRELKAGAFDAKIEKYFGPIVREPEDAAVDSALEASLDTPQKGPTPEDVRETIQDLASAFPQPSAPPPPAPPPAAPVVRAVEAPRSRATLSPSRPSIAVPARSGSGANIPARSSSATNISAAPTIGGRSTAPVPRSAPPTIGSGRSGAATTQKPAQEGVVVSRQSVIVGKDNNQTRGAADFWKTEPRAAPEPTFGGDLISEKSLDEVILAYLSEDAPKK